MSIPKLSIRRRLLVLGLVPLLALAGIGGGLVLSEAGRRAESHTLVDLVALSTRVTDLVHTLQAERGMTGTFVNSRGATMADSLPAARAATDAAVTELDAFLEENPGLPASAAEAVADSRSQAQGLIAARAQVDSFARPGPEFVGAYTTVVRSLLDDLAPVVASTTNAELARELATIADLSQAKEATGILRAQLAAAFAADSFAPGQRSTVIHLDARRAAYVDAVFTAHPQIVAAMETIEGAPHTAEMHRVIDAATAVDGGFGQDSAAWFALASTVVDEMRALETRALSEVAQGADAAAGSATRSLALWLAVIVAVTAVTVSLLVTTSRHIVACLRRMQVALDALRDGRLSERVDVVGDDEVSQMGVALNAALDSVEGAVLDISRAAHQLEGSADELGGVAVSMRTAAGDSATRAQSASHTATRVSQDVESLSGASDELRGAIREISDSAQSAQGIVDAAVGSAQEAATAVAELEASSAGIEEVLRTVAQISEQTNLLALNATIEAARAGDAGKGFAVVAGEVKDLAQGTTAATEDIGRRVEQLRADMHAAVKRIEEVGATVAEMDKIQAAIAAAVEQQTATTGLIGEHIGQAAAGSRDIAGRVTGVADSARTADEAATATQASAQSLSGLAHQLTQIVERFEVRVG